MAEIEGHTSFEDILNEVERDETLRGDGERTGRSASDAPAGEGQGAVSGGFDGIPGLGALLGNPEMLRKIPALLQVMKSVSDSGGGREHPAGGGKGEHPASPVGLLVALRPYLGENRRRAVDTMIRVSKLSDTLRSLK